MRLGEQQELFSKLIAQHMLWLIKQGYEIRCGDFFRDPRVHGAVGEKKAYGASYSMHKDKCAADLNLFWDGKYLNKTSDHLESGEKWESRHELTAWGGRWNDGNHYSLTRDGRK